MNKKYDFHTIENKWRPYWQAIDLYKTGEDPQKPNYTILDYFPYPSGEGLSVGHCRNYVPSCIAARYKRMTGYNVLHPMGWDAFGLPAENYAIAHHIHPRESTAQFAANYKRQMQLVECSYDWSREINSTDPDYYRWTQWFFLLLFKRGLAYQAMSSQWWCDQCQTILANEQVEHGRCWRCDSPVSKRDLMQWHFKITAYADRLIADLDTVNWPERIKTMQRNWIGRSEGAEVLFTVETSDVPKTSDVYEIITFTTRPDTLFGVTFLALAPEHPLVREIGTEAQRTATSAALSAGVANYIQSTRRLSEIERQSTERAKTGVFTGLYARHPFTDEPIPIWVADYVLPGYGSGAVMGVPAHDERDFAFAQTYNLRIVNVVNPDETGPDETACFTGYGRLVNSGPYTGMDSAAAITAITADLSAQGKGRPQVTYRLRDWLISRQRYWGAPIPIIHCSTCGPVAAPAADLPVRLPEMADFAPAGDGRSPLARVSEWVNTTCPQCGGAAQRETDTMDGFACSSWYFLRFASPHEAARPFDPEAAARWLPVDTYIGGAEQAVMHLLYARFWTKVMADAGLIDFVEPFSELKNQGMLHSAVDRQKMSKSKGNVVTPDEVIARHGTDALRLYVVFLGPFDADVIWDDVGIRGITRFLDRFWRLAHSGFDAKAQSGKESEEFERERHRVIKRVTADIEGYRFNTAVAALMEYLNYLHDHRDVPAGQWQAALESFAILLAPFAPFITEEAWQTVWGYTDSIHRQSWPSYDEALTTAVAVRLAVQINGKVRDHITIPADMAEAEIRQLAVNQAQRYVNGRIPHNIIVVPGRLVNIVI
ncbi:MAG: leucine--tRNA ligase [Chloroflexi bacterium]|nr:leucine--tRNA ligase [Ardenticatenaceae bacterium]MBL1127967.1 leucine--tRNA ligase [Chloroflexota bacterium]NOG34039.1 leucine--tRNA ligase [Chloroflexota bacterium]GIK54457.1 MAG: leucine--tRNA ligase [Chloroflexota bacterium]